MNLKEVSELRRRFRPEKSAVSRVYGCYVNGSSREIISYLDESLGNMPLEEAESWGWGGGWEGAGNREGEGGRRARGVALPCLPLRALKPQATINMPSRFAFVS